jgi:hypothetical protein
LEVCRWNNVTSCNCVDSKLRLTDMVILDIGSNGICNPDNLPDKFAQDLVSYADFLVIGSLPLVLVAGSYGGCVHWTPPFLVDLVFHILQVKRVVIIQLLPKDVLLTLGIMNMLFR